MLNWLRRKTEPVPYDEDRAHALQPLIESYLEQAGDKGSWDTRPKDLEAGQAILGLDPRDQVVMLHLLLGRYVGEFARCRRPGGGSSFSSVNMVAIQVLQALMSQLFRRNLPYRDTDLVHLLKTANDDWKHFGWYRPHKVLLGAIERHYANQGLPAEIVPHIKKVGSLTRSWVHDSAEDRELRKRADILLGNENPSSITADFDWSKTLIRQLATAAEDRQTAWRPLIIHAMTASASKPSKKWLSTASEYLDAVTVDEFATLFASMTENIRAEKFDSCPLGDEDNSNLVKGLVWVGSMLPADGVARDIKSLAIYCFRKVPNVGAVSTKVGNACVYVLGQLPGLDSVAMLNELNQKVKYPSARRLIEKALDQAATRAGMDRLDLEELSVPGYGLDQQAEVRRDCDGYQAVISLESKDVVQLMWQKDATGKSQKTVPVAIKDAYADEIRALKRLVKDIKATLQSQVLRLESMYLQDRAWSFADWQDRFIQHPLLQVATRKLIWQFENGEQQWSGIWFNDRIVDAHGNAITQDRDLPGVRLWHPIFSSADEVMAWRSFLMENEITQPFKQAHREVYILTDAERVTEQYSNRFAAHVLKQHQMNALCQQRGWKYTLQGNFDSWNAPTLELPVWGLQVEYLVEGIESSENETGIFSYVASDQVRFTRDGEAVPLVDVDPLVFSEVMRNVDLFVGVCSIGNDPEWHDRGIEGYAHYWQEYSFGDLTASAQTRREVLELLLPRLKIGDRCRLEKRFLVVRGNLRTYKIHLGSANILMEPNDEYLCIVEGRSPKNNASKLFLPFEGDHRMAVVLSKAFLLAEDDKIKDKTILSQIKRR